MPLNDQQLSEAREGLRLALSVLGRAPTPQEAALLNPPRSHAYSAPAPGSEGGKVDEPTYSKMSHAERIDYCRRHGSRQP
jgi:hypothetical protein